MKTFLIYGFMRGVWGTWTVKTTPELIEKRAAALGITITAAEALQ